ncbi:TOBE domain-containing protein [Halorubrum ezzemoulense]|uniref:ABC transporter n=1 Tax=Halorubrum ezzemoulense DSM 17463 TaxID=1121945 RepID=A0A1X4HC58_HALEZ|nr:TOBE domain-containing protein [Halorubrum ezzemoulense]MDB9234475.1 TOBE domain-containing protein [Halorubrum ezzemoulense]MDB9248518.1 TOBE domain-containing protein [Halorubrum ezzemoulense]MDB9259144.1 TOBE domain-containing protein [Halorubrum ezzemoulense]MDB9262277.1 TOBE domain-containing protein [Halorubrum ezzemoulense]MDB9266163.1 TOBE domain-containing protein [Halorubrum ezzemoulense]
MGEPTDSGPAPAAGRGRAALIEDGVEFDGRDAALLRAVDAAGSVAGAASELGRSRARALTRIETLEDAYGTLVERRRGGEGGGGSRLAASARDLLDRYDRLQAVLAATASVPETVLDGTVAAVDGELAVVDTPVGELSGLHGGTVDDEDADDRADGRDADDRADGRGADDGADGRDADDGADGGAVAVGDAVQVRIGADAVTVNDAANAVDPDATSARNRLAGRVSRIDSGETVSTVRIVVEPVDRGGTDDAAVEVAALITAESIDRLGLAPGDPVSLRWKATATRLVAQVE